MKKVCVALQNWILKRVWSNQVLFNLILDENTDDTDINHTHETQIPTGVQQLSL